MNISRFAWYLMYVAIVASVGVYGYSLALRLGLNALVPFLLIGSVGSILMMTYTYLRG